MHRFGCCFHRLLEDLMCFVMHYIFCSFVGRWRHKIRKIAVEISQNVKYRPQSCAKYLVRLLLTLTLVALHSSLLYIHGRYCIAFQAMLLFYS